MNSASKIPWAFLLSNLVWILGGAIVLATWSYQEGTSRIEKTMISFVYKRKNVGSIYSLGFLLISAGIALSVHVPWIKIACALAAIAFAIHATARLIRHRRQGKSPTQEATKNLGDPVH